MHAMCACEGWVGGGGRHAVAAGASAQDAAAAAAAEGAIGVQVSVFRCPVGVRSVLSARVGCDRVGRRARVDPAGRGDAALHALDCVGLEACNRRWGRWAVGGG